MYFLFFYFFFFFFKQKTAYEMRISDWSSDVCSSDLSLHMRSFLFSWCLRSLKPFSYRDDQGRKKRSGQARGKRKRSDSEHARRGDEEIGRASCRERVCQYV